MLQRTIQVDQRYLILPVYKGTMSGHLRLLGESGIIREFDIRLADGPGEYQVFSDLESHLGKELTVEFEGSSAKSLDSVYLADEPVDPKTIYQEQLRPQYHFSSKRGWNNDPNGLFFVDGEYHLLYQHNPYSTDWGNLHWGHAVSADLVHWTELPTALYPDELGTMSTGSAVVDYQNTSGLSKTEVPVVVAFYTAGHASWVDEFTQCIAFSNDRGRTWEKYDGNPVMRQIVPGNRDPKVIWHSETERWVMPLYMAKSDYAIFGSTNLLEWEHLSDLSLPRISPSIPPTTECPEMFPLPVDGNENDIRWVFWAANTSYLVGSFDGYTFIPEQETRLLQPVGCAYAAQTWSNIPAEDGRRIQIAWMRQSTPGMPFGQFMTIPWSLGLSRRCEELVLTAEPVHEIDVLRQEQWSEKELALTPKSPIDAPVGGELLDIDVNIDLGQADAVGVKVRGVPIWYDRRVGALFCGSYTVLVPTDLRSLQLRILVDRASIEVFADRGAILIAAGIVLPPEDQKVIIFASGGQATVRNIRVSELRSAWGGQN